MLASALSLSVWTCVCYFAECVLTTMGEVLVGVRGGGTCNCGSIGVRLYGGCGKGKYLDLGGCWNVVGFQILEF